MNKSESYDFFGYELNLKWIASVSFSYYENQYHLVNKIDYLQEIKQEYIAYYQQCADFAVALSSVLEQHYQRLMGLAKSVQNRKVSGDEKADFSDGDLLHLCLKFTDQIIIIAHLIVTMRQSVYYKKYERIIKKAEQGVMDFSHEGILAYFDFMDHSLKEAIADNKDNKKRSEQGARMDWHDD